jgi:hypothetical protein
MANLKAFVRVIRLFVYPVYPPVILTQDLDLNFGPIYFYSSVAEASRI